MKFTDLASEREDAEHGIAVQAGAQVMRRHRALKLMNNVDPRHRPDTDHMDGRIKVTVT